MVFLHRLLLRLLLAMRWPLPLRSRPRLLLHHHAAMRRQSRLTGVVPHAGSGLSRALQHSPPALAAPAAPLLSRLPPRPRRRQPVAVPAETCCRSLLLLSLAAAAHHSPLALLKPGAARPVAQALQCGCICVCVCVCVYGEQQKKETELRNTRERERLRDL